MLYQTITIDGTVYELHPVAKPKANMSKAQLDAYAEYSGHMSGIYCSDEGKLSFLDNKIVKRCIKNPATFKTYHVKENGEIREIPRKLGNFIGWVKDNAGFYHYIFEGREVKSLEETKAITNLLETAKSSEDLVQTLRPLYAKMHIA